MKRKVLQTKADINCIYCVKQKYTYTTNPAKKKNKEGNLHLLKVGLHTKLSNTWEKNVFLVTERYVFFNKILITQLSRLWIRFCCACKLTHRSTGAHFMRYASSSWRNFPQILKVFINQRDDSQFQMKIQLNGVVTNSPGTKKKKKRRRFLCIQPKLTSWWWLFLKTVLATHTVRPDSRGWFCWQHC